jgi:peptidoglycan/xylan/chitin deacetylase (PgdA/CDA1 family)
MNTLTLQRSIADTKIRFAIIIVTLATIIVLGSFFLIDYLRFTVDKQSLFLSSLRYRAEYLVESQNMGFFAAAGSALSAPVTARVIEGDNRALGVPVLTYHSIVEDHDTEGEDHAHGRVSSFEGANVTLENFKDQMFTLKREGWHAVSYQEFDDYIHGRRDLPDKSFLITFDDGAKGSFYPVDPILAALNFKAVAFLLPGHSLGDRSTYYLNRRDVNLMKDTGRWDIQSHGQDIHVSLPVEPTGVIKDNALSNRLWLPELGRLETHEEYAARIENDLRVSKRNLEEALGIQVTGFAFPFGDYGQNASNDPLGQATVLEATRRHYSLAFYQNWNKGNFTFNYPNPDAFLIKRIPVQPDWDGKKLLEVLQAAAPKPLPYAEKISEKNGWEQDWGLMTIEGNTMHLKASPSTTGALAILDGTYTWENYEVKIPITWERGYVMVLFNMQSEGIGRACVFSEDGTVQLQDRTEEDIFVRRLVKSPKVRPGTHTIGAVSHGTTSACVFNGEYIIDATLPAGSGGIGVEAWAPELGTAEAFVTDVSAVKKGK